MSGTKKPVQPETNLAASPPGIGELPAEIRGLVEAARIRAARTINSELVLLYWRIGDRIRREILGGGPGVVRGKKLSLHCRDNFTCRTAGRIGI